MSYRNSQDGVLSHERLIEYLEYNIAAAEAALRKATGSRKVHNLAQVQALNDILTKIRAGDFDLDQNRAH